jgi:23S rRNA (uracil1939-C5)-methyltransferase
MDVSFLRWGNDLQVQIEKLVYGGDGLARLNADERGRRKALFVPFVLEGEHVQVEPAGSKTEFGRGRLQQVLQPSEKRIEAGCPYFQHCGGCHYQHTGYEHQLEIKTAILKETLARIGKIHLEKDVQVHPSPPWNYRNRTRMRVRGGPDFALGYNRFASHSLIPVEQCPISSPLINRAITAAWELGRAGRVPERVREIEFSANADDTRLQLTLLADKVEAMESRCQTMAEEYGRIFPELQSASLAEYVDTPGSPGNTEGRPVTIWGDSNFCYRISEFSYQVSAEAFFQTNRHLAGELIRVVIAEHRGGTAIDLYSGVGLFAVPLAQCFERVIAIESSPISFSDLQRNATPNVKAVNSTVDSFLSRNQKVRADLLVVDPPRAGLGEKVTQGLVASNSPRITYVSCDPSTLARDLHMLSACGFRIEGAHLVDLFPQTFHIETVVALSR